MTKDNFLKILIWLKVNDYAYIEYVSKEDDQRYFDYRTSKYLTKEQIISLAEQVGYNG